MSSKKQPDQSMKYNRNNQFDLSEMLMIQNASRFTKTPPNILFENHMTMTMVNVMRDVANSNHPFTK